MLFASSARPRRSARQGKPPPVVPERQGRPETMGVVTAACAWPARARAAVSCRAAEARKVLVRGLAFGARFAPVAMSTFTCVASRFRFVTLMSSLDDGWWREFNCEGHGRPRARGRYLAQYVDAGRPAGGPTRARALRSVVFFDRARIRRPDRR